MTTGVIDGVGQGTCMYRFSPRCHKPILPLYISAHLPHRVHHRLVVPTSPFRAERTGLRLVDELLVKMGGGDKMGGGGAGGGGGGANWGRT